MHVQIVRRLDEKMKTVSRLWSDDPEWSADARTFVFSDLCGDAIKAADFMGLPEANRLALLDALRERAHELSGRVNAREALGAVEQMNLSASVYEVDWGAPRRAAS